MTITLYGLQFSPPSRAVMLTAKLLGVPYEFKEVNLMKGDHLQPEFLEMNPLHTIPVINDDGFTLFESHAIVLYLIAKYSKDDSLYPQDLEQQATINQRLYFNSSALFARLLEAGASRMSGGSVPDEVLAKATATLTQTETLLGDNDWIAATPNYSVADVCLLSTIENYIATMPGLLDAHTKVVAWLHRGRETIPGFDDLTRPAVKGLCKIFGTEYKD